MSYYQEVLKDTPHSFYMMDGSTMVDISGHALIAGTIGALLPGVPLVAGASKSAIIGGGTYGAVVFPYLTPGTERQAVSLETWFQPTSTPVILASHYGDYDGLFWNGSEINFSIKLATGFVTVAWTPPVYIKMHVVGVYTGYSLQLYVNGRLMTSKLLTDLELATAITVTTNDGNIWWGNALANQQALGLYQYALTQDRIVAHYNAGNEASGSHAAATIHGGRHIEANKHTANIFHQKIWTDWTKGQYTASVNDTGVTAAVDPVTGLYVASTWQDILELESGGTSIDGVQIEYESEGTITIETSLDNGTTWAAASNTKRITGIAAGYNPTGKTVIVRAAFTAGAYGKLKSLRMTGIKDLTITSPVTLPVTLPAGTNILQDKDINLMDWNTGIEMPTGSITIGPNSEDGAAGYKSINFWYCTPSGTLSTNFTGTFYENGVSMTARTLTSLWTMVTLTSPTAFTSAITIGGGSMRLANISVYEDELSPAQIKDILQAYTGQVTRVSSSTDVIATITELDASIYAADWAITPAG